MYLKNKMVNKMKFLFFSVVSYLCFTIAIGKSSTCTTPNGEKANCIPLRTCPILQEAYESGNPSLEKFVEDSACGNGKLTVCCGTSLTTTTKNQDEETDTESKRRHALDKLLPTITYCGMQHYDDYFHDDNDTQVSVDEFPWLLDVESQANSPVGGRIVVCSGVLISKRYGLTLRECILSGNKPSYVYLTKIKVGRYEWRENVSCIETKYGQDCNDPSQQIYAEDWVYINNSNLALFRLAENVQFSDYVRPICLPTGNISRPKPNDLLQTTGWGSAIEDVWAKKRIAVRVTNKKRCNTLSTQPYGKKAVCAEALENITNTCAVVQGGPAMHKLGNNWFANGIIGDTSCNLGVHRIELITPEVVNFILDNLKP